MKIPESDLQCLTEDAEVGLDILEERLFFELNEREKRGDPAEPTSSEVEPRQNQEGQEARGGDDRDEEEADNSRDVPFPLGTPGIGRRRIRHGWSWSATTQHRTSRAFSQQPR